MALTCVTGGRECTGCMRCQERDESMFIGKCAECGEPVYAADDRYHIGDDVVHDDCAMMYIKRYYVNGVY